MANVLSTGTLFPAALVPQLVSLVHGKSALAALTQQTPIAFNGQREFTFTMDKEIDVVAENGAKTVGGVTVTPVTIVPVKVEYGARISDQFVYASEAERLDYLKAFTQGFAAKVARGIDLMAFHGINPRTGSESEVIGSNCFDKLVTQTVTYDEAAVDENIEDAIALVQEKEYDVTGLVLSPAAKSALAAQRTTDGARLYPQIAWGNEPGAINGLPTVGNATLSANASSDRALLGDFTGCFRWGYAKEIPMEIIRYGNPDNDAALGDLKGHNQIYLRAEAYIGWGILAPDAFAMIKVV